MQRRTMAHTLYCGSPKSYDLSWRGIGIVKRTRRPRFTGLFSVNPAPKAETSLNRVISFQLTFWSTLTSTRTGRGREIRCIRRSSFSAAGLAIGESAAWSNSGTEVNILFCKSLGEMGETGTPPGLRGRPNACIIIIHVKWFLFQTYFPLTSYFKHGKHWTFHIYLRTKSK